MSDPLQPNGLQPARLLFSWSFSGKNDGVGHYFLLQGIFPTQRLNPHLPPVSPALTSGFFTTEPPGKPSDNLLNDIFQYENRRNLLVRLLALASLGWEDPLEEEMATNSSVLPWKIPWTEPVGLQSMGSQKSWT